MDPYRCVLFEFNGTNQEKQTVLKYLEKNDQIYNWIVTELNKIRACIWWNGNVQFSVTPLRSFLKRLKRKIPGLEISRKMSTREGIVKVYDGNVPVLSNVNVSQRSSIFHLTKPVREHVLRMRYHKFHLPEQLKYKQLKLTKLNEKKLDSTNETEEPAPLEVDDPPPTVSNEEFKCYKYKVNLLARVTARIVDEVKELSRLLQPAEDTSSSMITHADEDTSSSMITHADEDTTSSMITHADEDTTSSMITHTDEDTTSSMITHADEDTTSSMITHADEDASSDENTPPLLIPPQ